MLNLENMSEYLEELSPELKDKVKGCKNTKELLQLAAHEGIELPDEVLGKVTGGEGEQVADCLQGQTASEVQFCCPNCGSTDGSVYQKDSIIGQMYSRYASIPANTKYLISNEYILECPNEIGRWFWAAYK